MTTSGLHRRPFEGRHLVSFLNNWKTGKYSNRVNIDQITMHYISMDFTRQALQINEKLFQILELFFELHFLHLHFFKIIVVLGLC